MNKKIISILYYMSTLIMLLIIFLIIANNVSSPIIDFQSSVKKLDNFGDLYSLANIVSRNIIVVLEIVIFNAVTLILVLLAMILTLLETKFNPIPKVLKIGLLLTNFLTVSYSLKIIANYDFPYDYSQVKNSIIILTIIIIIITIIKLILDFKDESLKKVNSLTYQLIYSFLQSLIAFGIFAYIYIILYKIIFQMINSALSLAIQKISTKIDSTINDAFSLEQIHRYLDSFVATQSEVINSIVTNDHKIEFLFLILYILAFIAACNVYKKMQGTSISFLGIAVLGVLIILVILSLTNNMNNLVGESILGGCEVC